VTIGPRRRVPMHPMSRALVGALLVELLSPPTARELGAPTPAARLPANALVPCRSDRRPEPPPTLRAPMLPHRSTVALPDQVADFPGATGWVTTAPLTA
jgi:hypothetical protein